MVFNKSNSNTIIIKNIINILFNYILYWIYNPTLICRYNNIQISQFNNCNYNRSFIRKIVNLNNIENSEMINNQKCTICFDEIKKASITKCGHIFDTKCIENWCDINYKNQNKINCPVCRTNLIEL